MDIDDLFSIFKFGVEKMATVALTSPMLSTSRDLTASPILPGTIARCPMLVGYHTGIIIGSDRIVELTGSGRIQICSFKEFKDMSHGIASNKIEVACDHLGRPYSRSGWANRARMFKDRYTEYDLLKNNCHGFVLQCILGHSRTPHSCRTIEQAVLEECNSRGRIHWYVPISEIDY